MAEVPFRFNDGSASDEITAVGTITGGTLTDGTLIISGGIITSSTLASPIITGVIALNSNSTTVPPLTLTASSLNDGVGALRIDSVEPDIYLNDTNGGFTTVTFANAGTASAAFGRNSGDDFYITVTADGSTWRNDTLVVDHDTGNIAVGYKFNVGTGDLQINGTDITATATELNQLSGITLGTAASANTGDFATAAQGALADTALQTVAVDGVTITGDGAGIPLSAVGGGGGTPGGNPGDVQVNDGAGGFGAATNLQDVAYLQTVATDGTTITGDGAGTPLSTTGLTETCMVRLDTSIVNFAPTGAYTLIQSNVPNPAIWDASPPNPNFDANTGLYTVATAGVYRISWSVAFRFTTAGQTQASRIYVNGSPAAQGTASTTGNWPVPGGSILLTLNPGDTVGLYGYISQAGTNLVGDTTSVGAVQMSIEKVSV